MRARVAPTPPVTLAEAPERKSVSASAVLQDLHDNGPADHFTISWAMGRLGGRSFLIVLLMLGIAGLAPGLGTFVGLLIAVTALQMAAERATPFFPRWIADRPLPARHLRRIVPYAIAALSFLERQIHPRWPAVIEATRLPTAVVIILLSVLLTLMPIPLSNLGPALVIAMISLTALEEDGLLLLLSLSAGLVLLALNLAFVWALARG